MNKIIISLAVLATAPLFSCGGGDNYEIPEPDQPVNPEQPSVKATAYITKVFDYRPAVGQFVNDMPKYEDGDNQENMNQKVLDAIGNNKKGMISLGGYGGYVIVGFDHTIENKPGLRDFRVLGNSFYSDSTKPEEPDGGSSEPGIIMVSHDTNGNGQPDDAWFEIAGSAHIDATQEPWYEIAKKAGNDVKTYFNYEITYHRPATEPSSSEEMKTYIKWEDNQGHSGFKMKNKHHSQTYYPKWIKENQMTFKGTCLPQNGIDKNGDGSYYVLYKFRFGYADNELDKKKDSCIDIDWAVDTKGNKAKLPGIDFIKIYTGVNQENGDIGESSTELKGIEDLHILGEEIESDK